MAAREEDVVVVRSLSADLRQIEVFLTLCEELSFSRTAARAGLTTSRVSQTIRELERSIGAELFARSSRRVSITPIGARLRDELAPAHARLSDAFDAVRAAAQGVSGTVRLGMYTPINGGPHLRGIIDRFQAEHPDADVRTIDTGFDAPEWLRHGDADLLAHRLPTSDRDLVVGPILSCESRVLVVAADHPLAERQRVTVDDLAGYPVTDSPVIARELTDALITPRDSTGRPLTRRVMRSFTEIIMQVAEGKLVHPTVASFLEYYAHPNVTAVPLEGLPPSSTALVWTTRGTTPLTAMFIETARSVMSEQSSGSFSERE